MLERAPVAAVNEQHQRWRARTGRMEQVDDLARRRPIGEAEFRTGGRLGPAGRLGPIGGGLARPAGENLRMFGNAGAVVVFGFEIDRRDRHEKTRQMAAKTWRIAAAGASEAGLWGHLILLCSRRKPGYDRGRRPP